MYQGVENIGLAAAANAYQRNNLAGIKRDFNVTWYYVRIIPFLGVSYDLLPWLSFLYLLLGTK